MTFKPSQGSKQEQALQHLQAQPSGTKLSCADFVATFGWDSSNVKNYLQSLIRHDLVVAEPMADSRKQCYRLAVQGKPPADAFEADERRGGQPLQRIVPAAQAPRPATRSPASVFHQAGPQAPASAVWKAAKTDKRSSAPKRATTPQQLTAVVATRATEREPRIACAVFNTGEMLLELPGKPPLRLDRDQCADLLRWLQKVQPTIHTETA
jgi:hypothetical protein